MRQFTDRHMDVDRFRRKLLEKQEQLLTEINRTAESAREYPETGAVDVVDQSVASERKESLFQQADRNRRLLNQVQSALTRIQRGNYGLCLDCGELIEERRLEAVPWAAYCVDDQSRRDAA
jgi:DnaK suppressor protein